MTISDNALYLTRQIRQCEQLARSALGLTEDVLMLRAGTAAFETLKRRYPHVRCIAVFCGAGNNAGDGYVLARLAWLENFDVRIYQYKIPEDLPTAASHAASAALQAGVPCYPLASADTDQIWQSVELIIDSLLGIGLHDAVHGPLANTIAQINASSLPVLAIDVPSGLDADRGSVAGIAVKAAVTVTFIALKIGMFTGDGPDYCGEVVCNTLGLESCLSNLQPTIRRIDPTLEAQQKILPCRRKNSHKGTYGHVLILGSGPGMPGAVCLTALAALRVGAGLVTIATHPDYAHQALPSLPEALIYPIYTAENLLPLLKKATVCVLGPGLGEDTWAMTVFSTILNHATELPKVIDASALHLLANLTQSNPITPHWILTPHPGEAASLLTCNASDIQANRYEAINRLQQQYGGAVVLKGVGSLVCLPEEGTWICTRGNPGMASAGMGDVLSGVLGGLLAQGATLANAAKLGVWLHAKAGDEAAQVLGERGLIAQDVIAFLQRQVNYSL